jgi:hypothetical protein
LRVQDHKSIAECKSKLFHITSQLTICGHLIGAKEKIEKILSTFYYTNWSLQLNIEIGILSSILNSFHICCWQGNIKLSSCKIQWNKLLASYHHKHILKVKYNEQQRVLSNSFQGRGHGKGNNTSQGKFIGKGSKFQRGGHGGGIGQGRTFCKHNDNILRKNQENKQEARDKYGNTLIGFQCGTKGHVKQVCRAPSHLVELYKKLLKRDGHKTHGTFLDVPAILPEILLVFYAPGKSNLDEFSYCIVDSGTSHTILQDQIYFSQVVLSQ